MLAFRAALRWRAAVPCAATAALSAAAFTTAAAAQAPSFYDVVETTSEGEDFAFSQLRGSVVYGVNVASR